MDRSNSDSSFSFSFLSVSFPFPAYSSSLIFTPNLELRKAPSLLELSICYACYWKLDKIKEINTRPTLVGALE